MIQQGQVFKLTAKGADGEPLWAYRYRLGGRSSARPQVGGFASRAEAQKALRKALDRIGPGRGGAITFAELVEEYLELHQAEPVTIAKLRWLLGKATNALGAKRIADLSPKDVYEWRLTIPEGHRFEATQALRQVLNRAVAWGLLDFNPAKHGVSNPQRRPKEMRPFESGHRSRQSPRSSDRCMDRWSSSAPQPDCDPRSCSGSSNTTSTVSLASFTCGARSRTAGSRTRRPG